ncbi:MAG: MFS transporter [Gammaproteobacteria bacterium]|jgi:NNP family nitrate/nitrite transporter-like MFS transporter|nr:MFS transporter [Gammaproteobacteria bacterium]MBT3858444.1 MFS transporter [Gammaproteobacteria bacterium]MBT3986818.1 MFS transporter [Gammaproteobacteria bacterium]MBT4256979.1 MFS transporter [Gammaproteobacteria bacterium]MBT4581198.1 MFS transporter [Gammaproteobacteria bacterium]
MITADTIPSSKQTKALSISTIAFTACFATWTIFSIIGIQLQQQLGLNETQFGLLIGTPILTGSLSRLFLGIWSDQYGGRVVLVAVMLSAAIATFLLSFVDSYQMALLAALGVGLAGGSFAVGIAYVSTWYPEEKQGTALGIFGVGNVGSAITSFGAPFVLVAFGWEAVAQIWAGALVVVAIIFWFVSEDDPTRAVLKEKNLKHKSLWEELEPLKKLQVWRFSIYYFFVFGAFVALALWLPRYLMGVYDLDLKTAGMLAAFYAVPASLFRAYGGHLSDKYGARTIMYLTFGVAMVCTFMLSYPKTDYIIHGIEGEIAFSTSMQLVPFLILIFVLGFFMSLGKAAVFKHIPVYYSDNVGAVGGLVGMVGGLGGFFLPIMFGVMNDLTGIWTSCFMLLFGIVTVSMLWMHFSILSMERKALGAKGELPELPEMHSIHKPEKHGEVMSHKLTEWDPDDEVFWETKGKKIARQNLWISIPCLLLAFSIWLVWSIVVAKLPSIGFDYTTNQLFWLAALPGLSGATLRIFYSFMVPIMGGRLWTTLTTASLLIPALGIGYAVQDPETPYVILLVLALLCGFGGGNFASSMANISFFYPKDKKGNALALNAGLGNAGVSIMQFLVPVVITMGVFGTLGGEPQQISATEQMWLQNAGFIWVPFLLIATAAAWMGLHDIVSAQASFKDQSIIFSRKQNWVMCVLYTGTFGSFIGYSAGFPLLSQLQFPEMDALRFAFLGPLVGALSRAGTGWISDKYGGGKVTFWTFISMVIAVLGVIYFLSIKDQPGAFWGFFAMFMFLFFATGVGNASTFQMIPVIMRLEMPRLMPHLTGIDQSRQVDREAAAIIGFTSAIAAYGAFFIPKSYGTSISLTGSPMAALWGFCFFYVICVVVTWWYYTRRGALLYETENKGSGGEGGEPAPAAS